MPCAVLMRFIMGPVVGITVKVPQAFIEVRMEGFCTSTLIQARYSLAPTHQSKGCCKDGNNLATT